MKSIASIVLVNFCIVMSARLSQVSTESPLRYLTKFTGGQPTNLQHRVAKRQSKLMRVDPLPMIWPSVTQSSGMPHAHAAGIDHEFAEAALSCNLSTIEEAQRQLNDENGQFCGSLWERYRLRSNYIRGNCSRVLTTNSCPSNCHSLLEDFRSTLGCCIINAYVNGTGLYILELLPLIKLSCVEHVRCSYSSCNLWKCSNRLSIDPPSS